MNTLTNLLSLLLWLALRLIPQPWMLGVVMAISTRESAAGNLCSDSRNRK